jgi:fibronectin-binding autotransporter adhesin
MERRRSGRIPASFFKSSWFFTTSVPKGDFGRIRRLLYFMIKSWKYSKRIDLPKNIMKFIKQFIPTALLLAMSATAHAGTHVWSGATSQFLSTPSNWSSGGAPFAGETAVVLVFPVSSTPRTVIHNVNGLVVDKIMIDGGQTTLTGSGATLTFSNAGGSNLVTTNTGLKTNVIDSSLPVVLSAMTFFDTDDFIEIRSVVSGSGGITSSGPLMFTGTASNTYTGTTIAKDYLKLGKTAGKNAFAGPIIVNNGYLINAANNQIPDNSTVTLYNNAGYVLNGFSETIGNLDLGAAFINSEGGTSILTLGGTVDVSEASTSIKGNIALSGTRTLNVAANANLTLDGVVSNSSGAVGGINKAGEGGLTLPGANTFTGPVNLGAGKAAVKNAAAFGTPAGGVTVAAGATLSFTNDLDILMEFGNETLNLSGTIYADVNTSWAGSIVLNGTASGFSGRTVNFTPREFKATGVISGSGTLVKKGDGCLTLAGTASNTYTGATLMTGGKIALFKEGGKDALTGPSVTVTGGVIVWALVNQINDSTALIVNNGTLTPFWVTETIASLSGAGGTIHLNGGSLLIGLNGIDTAFHGAFSGNGSVYKTGAGNMTLDQSSANGINFIVTAGTLTVDGGLNCTVSVNPGGTLRGKGTIPQINMNGGTVDLSQLKTGGLSVTGAGSQFISSLQANAPGGYGQTTVTGAVYLTGTSFYPMLGFVPYDGTSFTLIDNDGTDAVTGYFSGLPEGATFVLNGKLFTISYHGGDGNDVVITVSSGGLAPPVITAFVLGQPNNNQRTADIDVLAAPATVLGLQYSHDLKIWVDYAGKIATSNAEGFAHFHTSDNITAKRFYRVYVK